MRWWKNILLPLAVLIFFAGCTKSRIARNYKGDIKSLSALATLKVSSADWTRRFDAAILVLAPDKIRVEFFDLLGSTIFKVGFDGRQGWGWKDMKRVGFDIEPKSLAAVLLGENISEFSVNYSGYKKVQGRSFPFKIDLRAIDRDLLVEIRFKDVILNKDVNLANFKRVRGNL